MVQTEVDHIYVENREEILSLEWSCRIRISTTLVFVSSKRDLRPETLFVSHPVFWLNEDDTANQIQSAPRVVGNEMCIMSPDWAYSSMHSTSW